MLIILMFLPPFGDLRTGKKYAVNAGLSADPATSQLQLYNRAALDRHFKSTGRQLRSIGPAWANSP